MPAESPQSWVNNSELRMLYDQLKKLEVKEVCWYRIEHHSWQTGVVINFDTLWKWNWSINIGGPNLDITISGDRFFRILPDSDKDSFRDQILREIFDSVCWESQPRWLKGLMKWISWRVDESVA